MSIMDRILPVFRKNYPLEKRDVIWNYIMGMSMKSEVTEANLENMSSTPLVSGFGGFGSGGGRPELIKLAQALGIAGICNPENDAAHKKHIPAQPNVDSLTEDEILDRIQTALPFSITFPLFSGNYLQGLETNYGVMINRHIFYLWVLKRIMELCPNHNCGIIEIGAGFGVLGYYLHKIGYRDYTTIDLALINACQTYFLAKNLPDRNLIISGDVENPFDSQYTDSIKLLHSTDFVNVPQNRFAIMINMDGLTEMGIAEAEKYVQSDCAPVLFSINHEANTYRVIDLKQPQRKLTSRYPFWLRDGYVEEVYQPK